MDVTAKVFRDVEFRESKKGYHPEDVDEFLEQAAAGVDALHERLRQATDRAGRAEAAASEASSSDETLKRTLVLAQRTADMAVQESRDQAARIVASAEQQAQTIVSEAEERARRLHGEALADVHAELAKLEAIRAQAQHEVDQLARWADEHRTHLRATLSDALAMIDRADLQSPAPTSSPVDVPFARPSGGVPAYSRPVAHEPARTDQPGPATQPSGRADVLAPPRADDLDGGPATQAHAVGGAGNADRPAVGVVSPPVGEPSTTSGDATKALPAPLPPREEPHQPDDEAMDNFFEDNDFGDDRRFGGRLRRRR